MPILEYTKSGSIIINYLHKNASHTFVIVLITIEQTHLSSSNANNEISLHNTGMVTQVTQVMTCQLCIDIEICIYREIITN